MNYTHNIRLRERTWYGRRKRGGRLNDDELFRTGISGHTAEITDPAQDACKLYASGQLVVRAGFEWDYGSGPAVDTPDVIRASCAHDALCRLTNARLVPWSVRAEADTAYRRVLKRMGMPKWRRWAHYAAVRSYSVFIARWKDKRRV